jgi:hypothetical protein
VEVSIKKIRWQLFLLGIFKIPMIGFVRPKLVSLDTEKVCVAIRLKRRTKNHLNSMYFGALAVGADIAAGIHVFYFSEKYGKKISFAFKGMNAQFLKRAESMVRFECLEGKIVETALLKSIESGERINEVVNVIALNLSGEQVATFEMTVSLKVVG